MRFLKQHRLFLLPPLLLAALAQAAPVTSSAFDGTATEGGIHVVCHSFLLHTRTTLNATCNSAYGMNGELDEDSIWTWGASIDLAPEISEVCRDGLSLEATASAINLVTDGTSNCNNNDTDRVNLGDIIEWDGKRNFVWKSGYGPGT